MNFLLSLSLFFSSLLLLAKQQKGNSSLLSNSNSNSTIQFVAKCTQCHFFQADVTTVNSFICSQCYVYLCVKFVYIHFTFQFFQLFSNRLYSTRPTLFFSSLLAFLLAAASCVLHFLFLMVQIHLALRTQVTQVILIVSSLSFSFSLYLLQGKQQQQQHQQRNNKNSNLPGVRGWKRMCIGKERRGNHQRVVAYKV